MRQPNIARRGDGADDMGPHIGGCPAGLWLWPSSVRGTAIPIAAASCCRLTAVDDLFAGEVRLIWASTERSITLNAGIHYP
ncbi:MAG TPA: hypothetical protein VFH61_17065 [Thermoleophilia bacterium]|nr:hypothetical protein [Thermoleophilia bacterium]